MVRMGGLEPPTTWSQARWVAATLHPDEAMAAKGGVEPPSAGSEPAILPLNDSAAYTKVWWTRRESNPHHLGANQASSRWTTSPRSLLRVCTRPILLSTSLLRAAQPLAL